VHISLLQHPHSFKSSKRATDSNSPDPVLASSAR